MNLGSPLRMTREKSLMATAMVVIGIAGRLALVDYPNIETVMAMAILAGYFLGGVYMFLVPLAIMGFSDVLIYGALYGGRYETTAILGLTAFTWSGFLFAALIGRFSRRKVLTVVRGVALVTAVSIPATLAYDLWTTLGGWYFLYGPLMGWTLWEALVYLTPFALLHLLSSLLFVPLFGTLFGLLQEHGWDVLSPERSEAADPRVRE